MTTMPYVSGETPPMMKCGHAAQGNMTTPEGPIWACIIDAGLSVDAINVAEGDEIPNLEGRMAVCTYKRARGGVPHPDNAKPSSPALAFFNHTPNKDTDEYYCGCWGWD